MARKKKIKIVKAFKLWPTRNAGGTIWLCFYRERKWKA